MEAPEGPSQMIGSFSLIERLEKAIRVPASVVLGLSGNKKLLVAIAQTHYPVYTATYSVSLDELLSTRMSSEDYIAAAAVYLSKELMKP